MIAIYKKYTKLLEESGKSTADVCRATGIPESTMSMFKKRYEEGKNPMLSIDTASKIAGYFGVSVEDLIKEEEEKT